jgi:hypothetical protein
MNLIEKTKLLAELESKVPCPYLVYVLPDMQTSAAGKTDADARFIHDMRMNAPMLLEVLSLFQAGDADALGYAYHEMLEIHSDPGWDGVKECLRRLQKAANSMEATQ